MSETRRRRVMLDSDEDQDQEVIMKRRLTPPSASGSAKKRRLEVSALNDDGEGMVFDELALEDSSEDDQMERKRRRQLAERWSKLEKDSDHELSDDGKGSRGGRGLTSLARLRAQNPWKRSERSRDAIRLLMKDPVSPRSRGEEDEDSDDLDGFIVNSPESAKEALIGRGRNRSDSLSPSASPSKGSRGNILKIRRKKPTVIGSDKNRSRRNRHRDRRDKDQSASPSSSGGEETSNEEELSSDGKAAACSSSEGEGQTEQDAGWSTSRRGTRTGDVVDTKGKGKGRRGKRGGGVIQEKIATDEVDSCVEEPSGVSTRMGSVKHHSDDEGKGKNNESPKGRKKRSTRSCGKGYREAPRVERSSRANAAIAVDLSSDDDVEGCNRREDDYHPKEEGAAVLKTSKRKTLKNPEAKVKRKSSSSKRKNLKKGDDGDGDNEEDDEQKVEEEEEDRGTVPSESKRKMKMKNRAKKERKKLKKGDDGDGDNEEDDEQKVEEEEDRGTVLSESKRKMKVKNRAKKERKKLKKGDDGDGDNEEDDEQKVEEEEEDRGTVPSESKRKMKTKSRAKKERKKLKKGDDGDGDNEEGSDESKVMTSSSIPRVADSRRRRKSSAVKRRERLHDSGSGSRGSIGEEGEEDDDGDNKENLEELEERCGVDEDADFDDDFAENLRDDYEDDSGSSYGGDAVRTREGWSEGRENGSGGGGRYGDDQESEEEEDSSDAELDYDNEEDEGDASFSHAAFFHEMERSQDIGMSSLSMETMTLHDAFLFYVEYLAKATADEGAGQAFMEKMVTQPRLPEHARYNRAREMVEKKVCISRESLCGTWRQDFRDSILRYPHYVYQRVDTMVSRQCGACNRRSPTAIVAFLSGSSYDPRRVWDGLRWDKYLPEHWDNPNAMAFSKQKAQATHFLGQTCRHKSHLYHSLVHYKLYLVSKVSEKMRSDNGLEPENFRGIGGPRTSKKKKKLLLNFSENEYESLKSLLKKAQELNGVKWGSKVGLHGGGGKTFLQAGAASSILNWLSGELRPGQYEGLEERPDSSEDDDSEGNNNELSVGRGRLRRSSGGRYG